jgi:hypothetical protein
MAEKAAIPAAGVPEPGIVLAAGSMESAKQPLKQFTHRLGTEGKNRRSHLLRPPVISQLPTTLERKPILVSSSAFPLKRARRE